MATALPTIKLDMTGICDDACVEIHLVQLSPEVYSYTELVSQTKQVYNKHLVTLPNAHMDIRALARIIALLDVNVSKRQRAIDEYKKTLTDVVVNTDMHMVKFVCGVSDRKTYIYVSKDGGLTFTFTTDSGVLKADTIEEIVSSPQWNIIKTFDTVFTSVSNELHVDDIWTDGDLTMFGGTKKLCTMTGLCLSITKVFMNNKPELLYSAYHTSPIQHEKIENEVDDNVQSLSDT